MIQLLFELLLIVAIFAGLWCLVVYPCVYFITRYFEKKLKSDLADSEYGTKVRKKLEELEAKQKELAMLSKEKDVSVELASVDVEIVRLRKALTELEKDHPA